MKKIALLGMVLSLVGCAVPSVHVIPSPSIRVGSTIQIARMSQDPLGGVSKLIIALEKRGFVALEGEVGKTVTNKTSKGTETYRSTRASHYLTFTYSTERDPYYGIMSGRGSCRLVNIATQRAEVIVDMSNLPNNAADICADEIFKAANKK